MENLIFWIAVMIGMGAALFAYLRQERIREVSMFAVYLAIGAAILVAVVSIASAIEYNTLDEGSYESVSLLIACLLGFATSGIIAGRLSINFPRAFVWFGLTLFVAPYTGLNTYLTLGSSDIDVLVLGSKAFGCLVTFLLYCRYRHNLTPNQSFTVIAMLYCSMMVTFLASSDLSEPVRDLAACALLLLGLLPITSGLADNRVKRVLYVLMMALMVFVIGARLQHVAKGWTSHLLCLPVLLCATFAICWVRYQREVLPKSIYAFTLLFLGLMACWIVLPSEWENVDYLLAAAIISMCIAVAACWWHGIAAYWSFSPKHSLRTIFTMCCVIVLAIGVPLSLNIPLALLSAELGPTRRLTQLYDTILWPGDATFMQIALADEYFWASETKPFRFFKKTTTADAVLEQGTVPQDYYSYLATDQVMENMQQGITDSAGIGVEWPTNGIPIVRYVTESSLAAKNGLKRGDNILAMNGRLARDSQKEPSWSSMVKNGQPVTLTVRSVNGRIRRIVAQRQRTDEDAPFGKLFKSDSGKIVGYLYLQEFQEPQLESVEPIFELFHKMHVQNLIVDLRYNQGGEVYAAAKLASLIAGASHDGEVFVRFEHPWRYHRKNKDFVLSRDSLSLDVKHLVVITTNDTASASEILIAALKPYTNVITVGEKTFGKPYAMDPIHFGNKELLLITSRMNNANGESWANTGISADVSVTDDFTHQLGDENEGMLDTALKVLSRI